jgi:acylphosphatase
MHGGVGRHSVALAQFLAIVSGDVHGVGYRAYAQYHASRLGIAGFARNEWDGTVKVTAEGDREKLEALIEKLQKGPRGAAVSRVDVVWSEPTGNYRHFAVRY